MNKQKNEIVVSYPTHGVQAGAQVHYNQTSHTWTAYLSNGLERTLYSIKSYATFMNGGAA